MTAIGDAHPGELVSLSGRVVEVLYETGRTRVSRVESPGPSGTSILKEALGGGAVARTRHELRILRRLAGIPGIVQLVMAQGDDGLLFEDRGGRPLAAVISDTRGDIARCVAIGRDLAFAVAAMHKAGVVHKDINPANILLSGGGRPVLFDFDLASSFGEDRPGFGQLREIVGTLAYLAPEQSGRTGGSVDERADLYALGATLYELTVGQPPFGVGDPLQMVHAALAVVAVPPCEVDGRVPRPLSNIIVRLLEKEPDRRYQSAEGLAHDLSRLTEDLARGRREPFVLGVRDFPLRLSAPSRLVGRESELAELRSAFGAAATDGGARVVLVAGVSGVGKTAVVNSLRSMVATRNGWFVTGKFDQYRHDTDGAVVQALRRLGRLLLAGGDDEIAALRARIVSSVGLNLSLISSMAEFAVLLGTPPPGQPAPLPGDAHDLTVRRRQAVLDLLSAIASPERPVVLAIDDLQWATSTAVEFIDGVLNDERLSGVLLVGAYRTGDVDATHPLAAALQRWGRLDAPPVTLHLDNLPSAALGELLGEMLRLPAAQAADLAAAVGARTNGNPFDTVELVNALRRDGALVAGPSGWTWDATTIRRFVGDGDVVDLLATRIDLLPPASQELMEVMACLGGVIPIDVLVGAIGRIATVVQEDLVAALDDGLLVLEDDGSPAVRFRHDRVQQAAYGRMTPTERSRLHLEIGRRLVDTPEVETIAAEQYLHCFDDLDDPGIVGPEESRRAAELFVAAAVRVINPETADRFLTAAGVRLDVVGATPADALRVKVERHSHAVLYRLGRLAEADGVYARVVRRSDVPTDLVGPTCVQINSLTNRGEARAAVLLGLDLLGRLGIDVPKDDFGVDLVRSYPRMVEWAVRLDLAADVIHPQTTSRRILAAATLIRRMLAPSSFWDPAVTAWLFYTSYRLWVENGPSAPLVANLSSTRPIVLLPDGYRTAYVIGKHVLALGEARSYLAETAHARYNLSLCQHWFEPLEDLVPAAHLAREELIRSGDLQIACYTYRSALDALLDTAPTLENVAVEVDSALAFATRTQNDHSHKSLLAYRQLVRALGGETFVPGGFQDGEFGETEHLDSLGSNRVAAALFHIYRALSAAVFGDGPTLIRHAAAAMPLLRYISSLYPTALAYLLQGLALSGRICATTPDQHPILLAELDSCHEWLTARAADAPGNFAHLATLLGAERAWAVGDHWKAMQAFTAARSQVAGRSRPWHQALIAERTALFHLTAGLDGPGRELMAEATRHYAAWCATGKVKQLIEKYPFLRTATTRPASESAGRDLAFTSSYFSSSDIDMLAILRASQALSTETNPDRLRTRLGELLRSMTGAGTVTIVQRDEDSTDWLVWDTTGGTSEGVPLTGPAAVAALPLSVFSYTERIGEPLLIEDATKDDRFARDPYLAGLDRCSLLVIPIHGRGVLRAVLVLENRSRSGAFSADRLEAINLVTGQLTVSLDNAQLYASLEQKVAERTAALADANRALEALSNTDALTSLPNRRHFDATIEREWARSHRRATPLGLAMIDVDHFKAYNDHYGHMAGDECLRLIATALGEGLRSNLDLVCRYGGEEFAAILPGADEATAMTVAERIRGLVADLRLPSPGNRSGIVTVSIGVAANLPRTGGDTASLVVAADRALYHAKASGRDQVRTFTRLPATLTPLR